MSDHDQETSTPAAALAVIEQPAPLALFGTNDPIQVIEVAARVATALAEVVNQRKLFAIVNGKKFPTVEAWTLLGSMLGVFPITEWVHELRNDDGSVRGFEARVRAQTLAGRMIGAGEARCVKGESKTWHSNAQEFALSSMAQTRATSKALRGPLDFVFKLAGFQPTPAEEMTALDGAITTGEIAQDKASPETVAALKEAEAVTTGQVRRPQGIGSQPPSASIGAAQVGAPGSPPKPAGPRAKRQNVVPAPQGAPSERSGAAQAASSPSPAPAMTSTPPATLADDDDDDDGREQYLDALRLQAREAAAKLTALRIRYNNHKHAKEIALGTMAPVEETPLSANPGADAALAQYIAKSEIFPGKTLITLDEQELIKVLADLDNLIAVVEARLKP